MKRRRLSPIAVVFAAFVTCNTNLCNPGPPGSQPSPCWTPGAGSTGTTSTCAPGANEHEPNDDVSEANAVPAALCAPQSLSGQLGNDVDVFRTTAPPCSNSAPTASLVAKDPSLRLCLFVACRHGKTIMQGCADPSVGPDAGLLVEEMHLPEGMLGCCVAGPGTVGVPTFSCDADYASVELARPTLDAYFVVDRMSGGSCTPYTVTYHF